MSKATSIQANLKRFTETKGVDTSNCLVRSSRQYERVSKGSKQYYWWFKFNQADLSKFKTVLLCGALDEAKTEFKILRVPVGYILDNLGKVEVSHDGRITLYVLTDEFTDIRAKERLSLAEFLVN